jgi:hypothetical protein
LEGCHDDTPHDPQDRSLYDGRIHRWDFCGSAGTAERGRDAEYGLGLQTVELPCGRLWGHSGGIFGYATIAMSTEDGRRQLALSVNPWVEGDPNPPLLDLALTAFCSPAEAGADAAGTPLRMLSRW